MLINNEGAASMIMIRLKISPDPLAQGKAVMVASETPCTPPAQPDDFRHDQKGAGSHSQDYLHELGFDKLVQTLQRRNVLVDQVWVYLITPGDPQEAFVPAGSNDEVDVTLLPRNEWRPGLSEEGINLAARCFREKRQQTSEARVACNTPLEDGKFSRKTMNVGIWTWCQLCFRRKMDMGTQEAYATNVGLNSTVATVQLEI